MIYKLLLYEFLSEKDQNYDPILEVYRPTEEKIRFSIIYLIKRESSHQAQALCDPFTLAPQGLTIDPYCPQNRYNSVSCF
jgi:hypothetical protein